MLPEALLACAMMVHPVTLNAVVGVESGGRPAAIHVNGLAVQPHPVDAADAAAIAHRYIAEGKTVDIGLMQVNSRNLADLNLTVEQVLDPCVNLHAGGAILARFYTAAAQRYGKGQLALAVALSGYNTGSDRRGLQNGYVARYYSVPSMEAAQRAAKVALVSTDRHASDTEVW